MMRAYPIGQTLLIVVAMTLVACGNGGELSRSKAEKEIEEKLNQGGDFPTVTVQLGRAFFQIPEGDYHIGYVCRSLMENGRNPGGFVPYTHPRGKWKYWGFAADEGFITATAQIYTYRDLGVERSAFACDYSLTDKAKPYVVKTDQGGLVTLRVVDKVDVEVTGITKASELYGQTVSEAEFNLTYQFNPLGKALAEPFRELSGTKENGKTKEEGKAAFRLYDDGWRLLVN